MSDSPSHKRQKLSRVAASCSTAPPTAASFQLLSQLPQDLLAQVTSHLPVVTLLVLQRACHALADLRADESYMAEAWSGAFLSILSGSKLPGWTLRLKQCVLGQQQLIPVHVWQAALPALRAAVAKRRDDDKDERRRQQHQQLRQWVEQPHPSRWVYVRRNEKSELCEVDDSSVQSSEGVEHVEVLSDIDRKAVIDCTPQYRDAEVRCRLVLQACPYLQHFAFAIDAVTHVEPSHEDTFALVPRLRYLELVLRDSSQQAAELLIDTPPVDFERLLDSLPQLTELRCYDVYLGVSDLLDIASHSTLEEVLIKAAGKQLGDAGWIGAEMNFPIDEATDCLEMEQAAATMVFDGVTEEEEELSPDETAFAHHSEPANSTEMKANENEEQVPDWTRDDVRRMQAALTRTQPTRRSCKMRLALADWLHRRLRRGGLHTDQKQEQPWLLRHYRAQVALLRSTLQRQLSELAAASASTAEETRASDRVERLELLYMQLQHHWVACFRAVDRLKSLRTEQAELTARMEQLSPTELVAAAASLARVEAELLEKQHKAAEADGRQCALMEQVESMLLTMEAEEQRGGAKFDALLEQVLKENGHHQPWIEKALGPRKRPLWQSGTAATMH